MRLDLRSLCLAALAPAFAATSVAAGAPRPLDAPALAAATDGYEKLLAAHVRADGGVDYAGLDADRPALERFVRTYGALSFEGADDAAKKAGYINLYNAAMMSALLDWARSQKLAPSGPKFLQTRIDDVRVPGGNLWSGDAKLSLGGHQVTLDDLEHGLLRGHADGELAALKVATLDPRLHAAVNCAALSCPRLRQAAFRPATVDAQLDGNMRDFLSSDAQFRKVGDGTLRANQIVYWYYDDFDAAGKAAGKGGAGGYLAAFVEPAAKDAAWKKRHLQTNFDDRSKVALKLSSAFEFFYDWRVDDQRNEP